MIKNNKLAIIISSAVILIPILVGVILWDSMPEEIAVHWDINGQPDVFAGKGFAFVGMPLIMLALHWISILTATLDKRNNRQSDKIVGLMLFTMPALTLVVFGLICSSAFNVKLDITMIIPLFAGVLFMVMGNYFPKCKQNGIMGIRTQWTLEDEACWHATHRFAGKATFIGGILILFTAFLPGMVSFIVMMSIVVAMAFITTAYSYVYYKKHKNS